MMRGRGRVGLPISTLPAAILALALSLGAIAPAAAARGISTDGLRPGTSTGRAGLWLARYKPGFYARSLAVSPDGDAVYVGASASSSGASTVAYGAVTGVQRWVATTPLDSSAYVAVSPDSSRVYMASATEGQGGDQDYTTTALDSLTGEQLWTATYEGPGDSTDVPLAIAASPDGSTVFVTGRSDGAFHGFPDFATVAYDAASGVQLWVARYSGLNTGDNIATLIEVGPDSDVVYVSGGSAGNPFYNDFATVAYDASSGATRWEARWNSSGTRGDTPYALAVSPDGSRVYVAGCTGDIDVCYHSDMATIAYDAATGSQIWLRTFDGPGNNDGGDVAEGVAVSPDGTRVYVGGRTEGVTSIDYGVVTYDAASGQLVWKGVYNGPGNTDDIAAALALSPSGTRVYVTGYSSSGSFSSYDYATVAFDATNGRKAWFAIYDSQVHDSDSAALIGVSPDSTMVFVSGWSVKEGNPTEYDVVTIAYTA